MAVRVPIRTDDGAPTSRTLVDDAVAPGARGVVEIRSLAAGTGELLRFPGAESAAVVLEGAGRWRGDGRDDKLRPGEGMYAPAGVHQEWAAPDEPCTLLLVHAEAEPTADTPRAVHFTAARDTGDGVLGSVGGFDGMGVSWLATTRTVGAQRLVVATSTFTDGGSHGLHRHAHADEFFLVVEGSGRHLTESGEIRMAQGDLVFIPANEWHGYRTDPGTVTRALYGYLGAGSLEAACYELAEAEVPA